MTTVVKIICWLTIIATLGAAFYYGAAFMKNLEKLSGSRVLVKLLIILTASLTVLFKGIFGLHILAPEPGVLSTGNLWLLLLIVVIPTQTWYAAVIDLLCIIYLGSLHPASTSSSPTGLTTFTCMILLIHGIGLFIDHRMEKKEKPAEAAQVTEGEEEPAEK